MTMWRFIYVRHLHNMLVLACLLIGISAAAQPLEYVRQARLMGTDFEFRIVDTAGADHAEALLDLCVDEVTRIENILSEWIRESEVSRLNALSGIAPLAISQELYALIDRCLRISRSTQGAFDISSVGLNDLWTFDGQTERNLPDPALIEAYLRTVGHEMIRLEKPSTAFLTRAGMQIGFGAIGKGYAADRVKSMLTFLGIENGVVNASGDLTAWGTAADSTPWRVGIADPEQPDEPLLWLPVTDASVATSGNYERYFMHDGTRYGHILDPRTGYPATGVKSVTVINPSAELADALATAVFVMGVEAGLHLIEQIRDTECLIIDDQNAVHLSSGMNLDP